jgi:hypothetical protein
LPNKKKMPIKNLLWLQQKRCQVFQVGAVKLCSMRSSKLATGTFSAQPE